MDLKRPENKVTLIDKIKTLANDIRTFLIVLVNQDHHKAALMYYWLRNYIQYIKQEWYGYRCPFEVTKTK